LKGPQKNLMNTVLFGGRHPGEKKIVSEKKFKKRDKQRPFGGSSLEKKKGGTREKKKSLKKRLQRILMR